MAQVVRYCVVVAQKQPETSPASSETIGQRLSKWRKEEGWSAQKLADESGVTRSVITNIENGRRDDMSVSELMALSDALRLPPAALLFDITRPFAPSGDPDEDDSSDAPEGRAGRRSLGIFPRNIDLVDWLNATETTIEADPELADFEQRLEALDAVVVYPIGLTVQATFGPAGRKARSILTAARGAERALIRYEKARRDLLLFVRDTWAVRSERDKSDQMDAAMTAGKVIGTAIGAELLVEVSETDQDAVAKLMRDFDAAASNLRDAQTQVRMAGGNPDTTAFAMSRAGLMGIVQSMPHEPIAVTARRGGLSDDVVESPLRLHRYDEYENLRARLGLPPTPGGDDTDG